MGLNMYERNAIVIDRYFSEMFGYGDKNNLKNNYKNYYELIEKLEQYQESSKIEDKIMSEFDKIANEIKETQKTQDTLYKRNLKLQENRKDLFDVLDEDADSLRKKFDKIENDMNKNQEEIKANTEKFINEIAEFNEKSASRTQCGRNRRITESEYQKKLNETINNFQEINSEKVGIAKEFFKKDNKEITTAISETIIKNGEKEKVPFNRDVIEKAVKIETDIEEKTIEILCMAYDKTIRMLSEIRSDNVKVDKHKKFIKDCESKLHFLNAVKEYVILFLDNERLNVVGGEKEHRKLMEKACENIDKDIIEIQNLYELILKEITGKSTKKAYKELYNPEYLLNLEDEEKEFEKNVSKLNMIGTIIYPDYWRVEGMRKIFDIFKTIITENYQKDLTEYEPIDIKSDDEFNDEEDEKSEDDKFYIDDIWSDSDFDEDDYEEDIKEDENNKSEDDDENEDDDDNDDDDDIDYDGIDFEDEYEEDENENDDESKDEEDDDEFEFDFGDDDDDDDSDIDNDEYEEESEQYEDDKDREIDEILGFYDDEDDKDYEDEEDEKDDESEDDDSDMDLDFDFGDEDEEQDEEVESRSKNKKSSKSSKSMKKEKISKTSNNKKSRNNKNSTIDFDIYEDFKDDINKVEKKNKKSFFKKK